MYLRKFFRTAFVFALVAPFQAGTEAMAADQSVRKGMIFAYRWCSTCHLDPGYPALSFKALANGGKISVEYLRRYLQNPRHRMMRFDVSEEELVNLHNYFMSERD